MAVYTPLSLTEIAPWFEREFSLGKAIDLRGIHGGIENSNFFLDTAQAGQTQEYVLTIFERLTAAQLPYYLELMLHLANKGIPVPKPIANRAGEILFTLHDKPAAIVTKLPGQSYLQPSNENCAMVGAMLAKMHLAGVDFQTEQANLRSIAWWRQIAPAVLPHLSATQQTLLNSELQFQEAFFASADYGQLPQGASHCDLFRDNVLFVERQQQTQLGGLFDFYFAGTDKWLFDLAVTVNDWCLTENHIDLDGQRLTALINAYQTIRPLGAGEKRSWSAMLRAAALRFWISRLWDFYLPRSAQMLTAHNPNHFEAILESRRKQKNNPL
ncbi:COG2334 Putative homoserine kinase type II (protein kinase fold) [Burkholderiaceae bacterium]|jgi:homoserine kinase type II